MRSENLVTQVIFVTLEDSGMAVNRMVTSAMAWCDGYTEPLLVPLTAWLEPPLPHQIRSKSLNNYSAHEQEKKFNFFFIF